MPKIIKTTLAITVLHEEGDEELVNQCDLNMLDVLISAGPCIASSLKRIARGEVSPETLKSELEAVGNDGHFFDTPD